jgi:hypothetical protein
LAQEAEGRCCYRRRLIGLRVGKGHEGYHRVSNRNLMLQPGGYASNALYLREAAYRSMLNEKLAVP